MNSHLKFASTLLLAWAVAMPAIVGTTWGVSLLWALVFDPASTAFIMAVLSTCCLIAGIVLRLVWWWKDRAAIAKLLKA